MTEGNETSSSAKVRELIFAYERHSNSSQPIEEYNGRPRAKSTGNALSYKRFRQPNVEFYSIVDIEKELVKIEAHLNYYEVYEKETHVAFQEQLFNVLTSIVNIDPEDQESAIQLKKKLIQETQKLATDLNSRLPFDGNNSYKGVRRTYSSYVRKEEAVVSTSSVKTQEHRAVLSSHHSALNGGFKSEESLNSTKDSVDLSSRHEDSSIDLHYLDERPQSSTPPPQKKIVDDDQSSVIPSVSKLKQFFSFRRGTKPEVKVTSASYSGLSRSQSLNIKTNKYTIIKKDKYGEGRKKEEAISETDEVMEKTNNQNISTSSRHELESNETINTSETITSNDELNSSESMVYMEPVKEIEEYVEEHNQETNNVSVSKLKSLFEKSQTETNEGLGLLTKKQNEFSSDFNIPFTAMNLGAYRLKRTISGNYMNFTGLIRNIDIHKKGDLSKSKSLSDLKITNFSYAKKDVGVDNDLSKEIDDDDDDDFEHVSIDIGKDSNEVNNNEVQNETVKENIDQTKETLTKIPVELGVESGTVKNLSREVSISGTSQTIQRENESIFLSKSVGTLKQAFENLGHSSGQKRKETNEENKHVFHKTTIESVPRNTTVTVEPVLKVPIQLRGSSTNVSRSTEVRENVSSSTVSTENNDDIKHILHRTIEPVLSTNGLEEPRLRVPVQLRTGFVNANQSQESTENTHQSRTEVSETSQLSVQQHQEEPFLKIPVQLRIGVGNIENTEETTKLNEYTVQEASRSLNSSRIVETLKQTYENISSSSSSELSNEEIKPILHRTVQPFSNDSGEPVLKVPVQLRTGFGNISHSHEVTENINVTSTGESNNEEVKHILHRTVEPILKDSEEPVLKVPIQLRTGFANISNAHEIENSEVTINDDHTVQYSTESLPLSGTVETLTQSFENIKLITSDELENEEVKAILHKKIEPIPSSTDGTGEPMLKIPVQLRTGFANFSQSHEVAEDLEIKEEEETINNTHTVQYATESLPLAGTVETLTQSFENIKLITSDELNNEQVKAILHREIQPIPNNTDGTEEPVLKIPIQLRAGFVNVNNSHEENLEVNEEIANNIQTVQNTSESSVASTGTVETLTQTFETIARSGELNNEEIKPILHRTIEPISNGAKDSEEPVLKIPVQLRTGFVNVSHSQEVTDNTSSSELSNEEVKTILHRTIEPIASSTDDTDEPVPKVPIQLRTGFANLSSTNEVTEHVEETKGVEHNIQNTNVTITSPGTVEALKDTFENLGTESSSGTTIEQTSERTVLKLPIELRTGFVNEYHLENAVLEHSSEHKTEISQDENIIKRNAEIQEPLLKVPIQLRLGNNVATTATVSSSENVRITTDIDKHEKVPIVDVTFHSSNLDESNILKDGTMSRARIEEKTGSFMKILESPTEFSTLVSSSALSRSQLASSTSKVSMSYSEKKTVQHTSSTHVSQRIVSSSSSSLSSQQSSKSHLQVLTEPMSYPLLSSWSQESPDEKSSVTIEEVEDEEERRQPKVNLNVSQENIIEEILKETDSLDNIDEEFEKMLKENTK